MKGTEAKELFRQLTRLYFADATVIYGRQSRIARPYLPLISITAGETTLVTFPPRSVIHGTDVAQYPVKMQLTLDLFTHGRALQEDGKTVAYENTATEDLTAFSMYLSSPFALEWCMKHDIAVLPDTAIRDLTGLVNDNNYEYRAQMTLVLSFMQRAIGRAGVLDESSLQFAHPADPGQFIPPWDGLYVYGPEEPPREQSEENGHTGGVQNMDDVFVKVAPVFTQTPSGGGTPDLAEQTGGYFTEAEPEELPYGKETKEEDERDE